MIRQSVLAGSWYEKNPNKLTNQIEEFLANVPSECLRNNVIGIIAPHAGYMYSGQTAAYAYKSLVDSSINRVIILAPSHYSYFNGIALSSSTHYETPLGLVPLDTDTINKLNKNSIFTINDNAHLREHSVEIHLPILQKVLKDFKLIPLIIGNLDFSDHITAAKAITEVMDNNTVLIASSDFTHYGKRFGYTPFKDNEKENIKALDMEGIEHIINHDSYSFLKYISKTGATICGYKPISLLLDILPKDSKVELIKYASSGEVTGDFEDSVSYAAILFTGTFKPNEFIENSENLSEEEKQLLLELAKDVLHTYIKTGSYKISEEFKSKLTPKLTKNQGAFVTLTKQGNLRGCIGYILPIEPLYITVIKNTINAAVHDTRFMPVTIDELKDIDIEISVLDVPKVVNSYNDIVIGKHGIILEKYGRSAVFLPQVAVEQNWDLETTLAHLSLKAGLPPDAWKEGARFKVFGAQVFGEKKHK